MAQELERQPTAAEIGKELNGMDPERVEELLGYKEDAFFILDEPIGEDKESLLGDFIDVTDRGVEEVVLEKVVCENLLSILDTIDKRARTVVELRLGLRGGTRRTLREIGEIVGDEKPLSHTRVGQIFDESMKLLVDTARDQGITADF